jgi:hypothetical protein
LSVDYSPFAGIFETKTHSHARTLRTSFSTKLTDAFDIIAGGVLTDTNHFGLFDYFTLFIPHLFLEWLKEADYEAFSKLLLPFFIILLGARFVIAAIGTILCLPIIAIVHGISNLIARQTYSEALEVIGKSNEQEQISLREHLIKRKLNLDDLDSTCKRVDDNNYELELKDRRSYYKDPFLNYRNPFLIKISKEDGIVKQSTNIHALFSLNIARAASNLENTQDHTFTNDDKNFILTI